MFSTTRSWVRRNRTTFAVGAGLLGAGYLAGQYLLGKLSEARQRMSDDRIARENLRRRFEQNQEDCTYTVLALLPTATENALMAIPVEKILQELQHRKSDKRARSTTGSEVAPSEVPSTVDEDSRSFASSSYIHASQMTGGAEASLSENAVQSNVYTNRSKVQLWNDLKLSSITRAFTLLYTLSLLTLLTRIQLNLLGRRNYLSSVVSLATPPQDGSKISLENRDDDNMDQDYGNDFETNRKYLTFSWWLLHRGWTAVMDKVETAVNEVFGALTPRDNVSFEALSELVLKVRKKVEGATEGERRMQNWLAYLLPPRSEEAFVLHESGVTDILQPGRSTVSESTIISISLRRLLDETSDLIDSPTFTHVMTLTLDAAFSLLIDHKMGVQAYNITPQESSTQAIFSGAPGITSESRIQEIPDEDTLSLPAELKQKTAKLATILAVFTRQAHAIGSGGNINSLIGAGGPDISGLTGPLLRDTNEYLAAMETVRDLEAFAAVVYSSNFEFEGVDASVIAEQGLSGDGSRKSEMKDDVGEDCFPDLQSSGNDSLESAWDKALTK